jgi:gas vesicle protein
LRFILRRCGVRKSTPHSSEFARLACGAFYAAVEYGSFFTFLRVRHFWFTFSQKYVEYSRKGLKSKYKTKGGAVMSDRGVDFVKGLFIGGLIGAVLGVLYAPKSGKETREDIARKTEDLMARAREEYELALDKSKRAYEVAVKRLKDVEVSAKEKVEEMENKVEAFAERGKETLLDGKGRLKRAIDAGVEAFKEEKEKTSA